MIHKKELNDSGQECVAGEDQNMGYNFTKYYIIEMMAFLPKPVKRCCVWVSGINRFLWEEDPA